MGGSTSCDARRARAPLPGVKVGVNVGVNRGDAAAPVGPTRGEAPRAPGPVIPLKAGEAMTKGRDKPGEAAPPKAAKAGDCSARAPLLG